MKKNRQEKNPFSTLVSILSILVVFVISASGNLGDAILFILALLPFIIAAAVFFAIKKNARSGGEANHTHDRIDHSSDLKINAKTGKVESRQHKVQVHSAREHWKQQLDGLLANGTIDKAEYNALMNREFR